MALLLVMALTIRFIRPNEADNERVQGGRGTNWPLHAKVWHRHALHALLLFTINAIHEVLTSKPPHSMGLLMIVALPRKINTEIDHLGLIVGSSTTVTSHIVSMQTTFTNTVTLNFIILQITYETTTWQE